MGSSVDALKNKVLATLGKPSAKVLGAKIGDSALVKEGVILLIGNNIGVDLKKLTLRKFTKQTKAMQTLSNLPKELEIFFDLGVDRQRAAAYLALLDKAKRKAWLERLIKRASEQYYKEGESELSDYEFDRWREVLEARFPQSKVLKEVGAPPKETLKKVKLPAPAGSLSKTNTPEEIKKWAPTKTLVATPKLDGISILLYYDASGRLKLAATRGDGLEGQDVTDKIFKIATPPPKKIPLKTKKGIVVRGEAVLDDKDFLELQEEEGLAYKNPRNTVAGIMNAKQPNLKVLKKIKLYVYAAYQPGTGLPINRDKEKVLKTLKKLGFLVVPWKKIRVASVKKESLEKTYEKIKPEGVAADGIVLEPDVAPKELLRFETGTVNPRWARAWKPELKPKVTVVRDIEWNVSRHGKLKPRVQIKPVEFGGATITWVTGKHAQYLKEKGIGKGAKVAVIRSGEVIPEITAVLEPVKPKLPKKCPVCGTKTVWQSVDLVCPNKNCPGRTERGLEHFLTTLKLEGFGPGTAKALMASGILKPEQLLTTDKKTFQEILGKKRGEQLWQKLHKDLAEVEVHKLALALGYFPQGFGEKKLKEIFIKKPQEWKEQLKATVKFAKEHGIKLKWPKETKAKAFFVFTGLRDKELQKLIESLGGEVVNSVSSKVAAVIAKDPKGTSTKLKKARELGIPIVPREKAVEFIEKVLVNRR